MIQTELFQELLKKNKHKGVFGEQKTYLILDNCSGNIKIGKAEKPKERLKTLCSDRDSRELLCYWNYDIESFLHNSLDKKRVKGEWFFLSEDDLFFFAYNFLPCEYVDDDAILKACRILEIKERYDNKELIEIIEDLNEQSDIMEAAMSDCLREIKSLKAELETYKNQANNIIINSNPIECIDIPLEKKEELPF